MMEFLNRKTVSNKNEVAFSYLEAEERAAVRSELVLSGPLPRQPRPS